MDEYYLDGLFLSQILWPNHYKLGKYFLKQRNSTDSSSRILEVPSGAGIYTYYISQYFKYKQLYAYDISEYSIEYTKQILNITGGENLSLHEVHEAAEVIYGAVDPEALSDVLQRNAVHTFVKMEDVINIIRN